MPRKMSAKSRDRIMELVRIDPTDLGPQLGFIAMKYSIPAESMADALGVTAGCMYRWFYGESKPAESHVKNVKKMLTILRRALLAHEFPLQGSYAERMKLMVDIVQRHKQ